MSRTYLLISLIAGAFSLGLSPSFAASVEPLSPRERADGSGAVFHGKVESLVAYRDEAGRIMTEATLRVKEVFKGRVPSLLALHYRGGTLGNRGETITAVPQLKPGEERLFFLSQTGSGRLSAVGGPEGALLIESPEEPTAASSMESGILQRMRDLFPSPAEGLDLRHLRIDEAGAVTQSAPDAFALQAEPEGLFLPPRRSILPDRDEPIRYLIDADELPPDMSEAQALEAVDNALAAWTAVSSVAFEFEGIESFGEAATDVPGDDGRLRIQLHDAYEVVGSSVLGIGGHSYTWNPQFPDGGSGATIDGTGFQRVTHSYVVMNHNASSLENLATFEAALCHEIGHALGLAHSSEDADESDPRLREAIMYYAIHGDDRGATLGAWDKDVIETVHPADTPPPYGFDRMLRVVTSHSPPANPEVNQVELRGYSLHAGNLTPELHFPTSNNGTFSFASPVVTYEPDGAFSDSEELDPAGGQAFDRVYARFDDGAHQSPPIEIRVIQYFFDSHANGLPDSWAEKHFGATAPVEGMSGPHDDPDGDGFTNLQEFLLGTDPLDAGSRLKVDRFDLSSIRFHARPYEVYELHVSADLDEWQASGQVVQPTGETGGIDLPESGPGDRFFRIQRVR